MTRPVGRWAWLFDIGSTFTKLAVVDLDDPSRRFRAQAPTTVATDVQEGLRAAVALVEADGGPLFAGAAYRAASSSAAGGLALVVSGLVPRLSGEAGRIAALGAGAKLVGVLSYELTADDLAGLERRPPDIVLLSGGTDGGDRTTLLANAEALASWPGCPTVVVAGNRAAADEAVAALEAGGIAAVKVANLLPELDRLVVEPAREAIRHEFLTNIVRAKGIDRVRGLLDADILPTPAAALGATEFLATEVLRCGLMAVEVGGATTNVHSWARERADESVVRRGLREPELWRTVEGDLGVRWNAKTLLELGRDWLEERSSDVQGLVAYCERVDAQPWLLPGAPLEREHDRLLAAFAVRTAVIRHCGTHRTVVLPDGPVVVQEGRDLRDVALLVGTGGSVISSDDPAGLLAGALAGTEPQSLVPGAAEIAVDANYLLYAVGLLRGGFPDEAAALCEAGLVTPSRV